MITEKIGSEDLHMAASAARPILCLPRTVCQPSGYIETSKLVPTSKSLEMVRKDSLLPMLHELLSEATLEFDANGGSFVTRSDNLGSNLTYTYNEPNFLSLDAFFYLKASQYAVGAAITLWVYDLLLTFESELELFWKQRDHIMVNVLYLMVSFLVLLKSKWKEAAFLCTIVHIIDSLLVLEPILYTV